MKILAIILGIIFFLMGAAFLWLMSEPAPEPAPVVVPVETVTEAEVESYVRMHIATLSPEPEVLGGTFYITRIEVQDGVGTVWYEDGHNAFVADFTYASTSEVSITSFVLRQN